MLPLTRPITRIRVVLRLTDYVRFPFHHGAPIRGLLGAALGSHDLGPGLVPFAPQSGITEFAPGDRYALGLTAIGEPSNILDRLRAGLGRIGTAGTSAKAKGPPTLFNNFSVEEVEPVGAPDIPGDVEQLVGRHTVTFRFVSPLRMERPDADKVDGHGYFDGAHFNPAVFFERIVKRVFLLEHGRYPTRDEVAAVVALAPPELQEVRGLWLDVPVRSSGPDHPRGFTLGGLLGTVTLTQVDPRMMPWLAVGRHVQVGEGLGYGFGRYWLCTEGLAADEAFAPVTTLLSRVAQIDRLREALVRVRENSDMPGVDGVRPAVFGGAETLGTLATALASRSSTPAALSGFLQSKPDGHVRALAVPTTADRVAQRATCDVLGPSIESLLEDCSYAYRKGFSRASAARAVQRAWDDGYRFVLDADISAFFDSVPWHVLFAKLHALWPQEPLVDLIKAWIRAPVRFGGQTLVRHGGLPQGSPVSPLLANLFLDEFDEALLGQQFRLVRYADDFVVLARSEEEARSAREAAAAALRTLGLELNADKTQVLPMDAGFSYLGYLFCRSVTLEARRPVPSSPFDLSPESIPRTSWLAQVPLEQVRALAPARVKAAPEPVKLDVSAHTREERRPLYLSGASTTASLEKRSLILRHGSDAAVRLPIDGLAHVVLLGRVRMTLAAVLRVVELGVPVYACSRNGELVTAMVPSEPEWGTWLAQARVGEDPRVRLALARAVVSAKLHNYAATLTRLRLEGEASKAVAAKLRDLSRSCEDSDAVDSLVGLEGSGAAAYFRHLAGALEPSWGFAGRQKHPPGDPVNAMLSFGYTVLLHHTSTALMAAGLNPRMGIIHRPHGAHHALASDLIEEFRYVVDRLVVAMIRRREVSREDFAPSADGRYPCLMVPAFRRAFVSRLEARLLTEVSVRGNGTRSYRAWLDHQAARLKDVVLARADAYPAFREP